jgi:hypothetical protein
MNNQETIQRFLEISKRYETLKDSLKEVQEELQKLMTVLGEGAHFQDPETELVYKIQKPTGTYISFKPIDYIRTKKVGEDKGSLAKTEAEKMGYKLGGK